jgi:hypothetical protein
VSTFGRTRVDAWLDGLTDEDRAAALAVMRDPAWPHNEANALFAEHGLVVSDQQFAKSRRRHGLAR